MKEDLIIPYIAHNNDVIFGDGKYYAVDKYGTTMGPFESEQDAQDFIDTQEKDRNEESSQTDVPWCDNRSA